MGDFPTYEDCLVNLNSATIADKALTVEPLTGKATGFVFTIGYQKHWPNDAVQAIPIRCYVTGANRLATRQWLKPGEWALVRGEVTDKGAIYAHQVDWLSKPSREPGEEDAYRVGMVASPWIIHTLMRGDRDAEPIRTARVLDRRIQSP